MALHGSHFEQRQAEIRRALRASKASKMVTDVGLQRALKASKISPKVTGVGVRRVLERGRISGRRMTDEDLQRLERMRAIREKFRARRFR